MRNKYTLYHRLSQSIANIKKQENLLPVFFNLCELDFTLDPSDSLVLLLIFLDKYKKFESNKYIISEMIYRLSRKLSTPDELLREAALNSLKELITSVPQKERYYYSSSINIANRYGADISSPNIFCDNPFERWRKKYYR